MSSAAESPSKVVHMSAPPPVRPSPASGHHHPPYGVLSPHREKQTVLPPHLRDPERVGVHDLIAQQSEPTRMSVDLAGLPSRNERRAEASGVLAIPRKKKVPEPKHQKFFAPHEKAQAAVLRYFNGEYEKHSHLDKLATVRHDSSGVKASLDEAAPPPPKGAVFDDVPSGHKGGRGPLSASIREDHIRDLLIAGKDSGAPISSRRASMRPEAVAAAQLSYFGTGVRDVINGEHHAAEATPSEDKYGWGMYGVHKERQSSVGGSAQRRHYHQTILDSNRVASLLAVPPAPAPGGRPSTAAPVMTSTPRSDARTDDWNFSGPKAGSRKMKYERELRGSTTAETFREVPPSPATFETTYRSTFKAERDPGPRTKTPPRRQLAPVYGGLNDPYRITSIY